MIRLGLAEAFGTVDFPALGTEVVKRKEQSTTGFFDQVSSEFKSLHQTSVEYELTLIHGSFSDLMRGDRLEIAEAIYVVREDPFFFDDGALVKVYLGKEHA